MVKQQKTNVVFYDFIKDKQLNDDSNFSNMNRYIIENIINKPEKLISKGTINGIGLCDLCKNERVVFISFVKMKDLQEGKTYSTLGNSTIRRILNPKEKDDGGKLNYSPCPLILIGLEDFTGAKIKNGDNEDILQYKIISQLNLDKRVNFFDSSIWHRYVPLNESFEVRFKEVMYDVIQCFELELYQTNAAKEFLEFQTRMLMNSYLAPVSGGHSSKIIPYQFHSETFFKQIYVDFLKKEFNEKLSWRFLLVDDYGDAHLKSGDKESAVIEKTKKEIIEKILCEFKEKNGIQLKMENAANGEQVTLDGKKIKKQAENVLRHTKQHLVESMYDVILLDYLLGKNTNPEKSSAGTREREFATELLKSINSEKENLKQNQGPLNRYWIFPISVFSYAMLDEMHERGIPHLNEHWYLSSGADPLNTPHLFCYKLLQFMQMQVKHARSFQNTEEFINGIFPEKEIKDEISIQKLAKKNYSKFLKDMNAFEMLRDDKKQKSIFADSFLDNHKDLDDAFWGHLHHLIFMLGHEPANEWEKMWDEFNIVEERLKKFENKTETEKIDYLDPIRNYIINLQKQTRGL